jgi:putative ABC transport system substrate-binding protein
MGAVAMKVPGGTFVAVLAIGLVTLPLMAEAQRAEKVWRIGVLGGQSPEASIGSTPIVALREGLRELGYLEGQNLVIEWRWAQGKPERFPDLASDLVRRKVDVIVAAVNEAIRAARDATTTIPIVMVFSADPVAQGFVASLGRPGGNITGTTLQAPELVGKGLQLLSEAVPNISRVAVLRDPRDPGRREDIRETEAAARALGVRLQILEVRSPGDLDDAFGTMVRDRVGGAAIEPSIMTFAHRARIAQLAARHRLPTTSLMREYAEAGCLLSYGTNNPALARRAASFVDKILKGAKPGDLPVEQPTKYELVINMKTAQALQLTIPASLLRRADHVIE